MSEVDRKRLGRAGERAAARYLRRHGHLILARNYRCPLGEIDLITSDGALIVFVEIKTRSNSDAVDWQGVVRDHQWHRIERAAQYFLQRYIVSARPARFDLVTVMWRRRCFPIIEHFADAHTARCA